MSAQDPQHVPGAYERTDARFKPIALLALGLIAVVALVAVAMRIVFRSLDPIDADERQRLHPLAVESAPPPPNLQAQPQLDLAEFRARQAQTLSTYGWVDREAGIVRIPIERAMDLIVERAAAHK